MDFKRVERIPATKAFISDNHEAILAKTPIVQAEFDAFPTFVPAKDNHPDSDTVTMPVATGKGVTYARITLEYDASGVTQHGLITDAYLRVVALAREIVAVYDAATTRQPQNDP